MAARHRHKFQRLSDVALFCECGATKYVTEPVCTRAHTYPATWIWQDPYTTYPYRPNTITTGGTTSPRFPDGTTVTYTDGTKWDADGA